MSNMNYCRFENTYGDLLDCYHRVEEEDLSKSEKRYRKLMIELCKKLAEYNFDEEEKEEEEI